MAFLPAAEACSGRNMSSSNSWNLSMWASFKEDNIGDKLSQHLATLDMTLPRFRHHKKTMFTNTEQQHFLLLLLVVVLVVVVVE